MHLGTIKKAERSDELVFRLFETHGSRACAKITTAFEIKEAYITDMLENKLQQIELVDGQIQLDFSPYEICTILLKY